MFNINLFFLRIYYYIDFFIVSHVILEQYAKQIKNAWCFFNQWLNVG